MASLLRIKRSGSAGDPSTLGQGELACSYLADNGSNGGDRLYIGTGTEVAGNAVNHEVVGGKYFTSKLDHALGTLTPNSAILVDANSKIDVLNVDNVTINGNTISTTNANGTLILDPLGSGAIAVSGAKITGMATPTADSDAATKAYVDTMAGSTSFTIAGDGGTDTFNAASGTLNIIGGTALTSAVTNDQVSIALDNTAVTAGSYGSQVAIPTFTVDAQGRVTAAGTASITTSLTVNGDAISLVDSALAFTASGTGLSRSYTSTTNTVDYALAAATTTALGAASFNTTDFNVSSGAVNLKETVLMQITTDTGAMSPDTHAASILGGEGMNVTHAGSTITVAGEAATTSNLGVASFATADFGVSSGAVSLSDTVLKGITTDTGALTIASHGVSILGAEGINVTHSGTTISVAGEEATASNLGVASFNSTDFDIASGAVSIKDGSITNTYLTNDGITIGSTDTSLGGTITDLVGLTGVTVDKIRIDANKITTATDTNDLILDPKGGDSAGGRVIIWGDLLVQGTNTIVNSTTMSINDKNLVLADSAADATAANGAGITINGAAATMLYASTGDKFVFNKNVDAPELYRNGTVLREYIEDHLAGTFFQAGEGMDITHNDAGNTMTFAAEVSTISNLGVASFDSDVFTVSSGAVTVTTLDGGTY